MWKTSVTCTTICSQIDRGIPFFCLSFLCTTPGPLHTNHHHHDNDDDNNDNDDDDDDDDVVVDDDVDDGDDGRFQRHYSRFLQSPHCVTNCLQHVRSSGPGAIVCKSCATHRALITCNMPCYVPRGTKRQLGI